MPNQNDKGPRIKPIHLQRPDNKEPGNGLWDPRYDNLELRRLDKVRKKRITLRSLNRLRKVREFKKLEKLRRETIVGKMYAAPSDTGGGGLF